MRQLLTSLARHRPTLRIRDLLGAVFLTTAAVELVGAGVLFLAFVRTHTVPHALWLAIFHSVSAFCNAGLSLWSDSLIRYAADPLVNLTMMSLIVLGGLGCVVLVELRTWLVARVRYAGTAARLSFHARLVLTAMVVAIVGGALLLLGLELGNVLAHRSWGERFLIASFQSVSARTAGFNTVELAALANPTLLVLSVLMFVGAGPGSMAGGVKLAMAAVVCALVRSRTRGNREVRLLGRAIGELTVQRAVVLLVLAVLLIGTTVCTIEMVQASGPPSLYQRGELLEVLFEAVSAFGTVALSMGITAKFDVIAKLLLIGLMYIGRLGPLILMDFFTHLPPAPPVRYATEELMVG